MISYVVRSNEVLMAVICPNCDESIRIMEHDDSGELFSRNGEFTQVFKYECLSCGSHIESELRCLCQAKAIDDSLNCCPNSANGTIKFTGYCLPVCATHHNFFVSIGFESGQQPTTP